MTNWRSSTWGAALALTLAGPLAAAPGPAYGVYLRLADGPAGSYAAMVAAVCRPGSSRSPTTATRASLNASV